MKTVLIFLFIFFLTINCGGPFSPAPYSHRLNEPEFKKSHSRMKEKFASEILKFLHTPYRWGGTTVNGVDCSGLVLTLYKKAANISLPHSTREIYKLGTPVSRSSLVFGDLVFFNTKTGFIPNHMGLYLSQGKFLHASVSRGVTLDQLDSKPYISQLVGFRRILK
ncbi:MAG: C40 family peptidase [candidate division KSB1 bacterium]|nr:C40 family peptidase [candidate division KSB1 bacterium]